MNGSFYGSVNSSCEIKVQLNSLSHELAFVNDTSVFSVNVTLSRGFSIFDEVVGIGSFGFGTGLTQVFSIINSDSFSSRADINNQNIFSFNSDIEVSLSNPSQSIFYYSGDYDNDGVIEQVFN